MVIGAIVSPCGTNVSSGIDAYTYRAITTDSPHHDTDIRGVIVVTLNYIAIAQSVQDIALSDIAVSLLFAQMA
jgi:hypothetical protein